MGAVMRQGGERYQNHGPRTCILNGVRDAGLNGETQGLSFRHADIAQRTAFADANESRPNDHENFRGLFVIMIAADRTRRGINHMNIALAGQQRFVHRFDHPTPPVAEKLHRLDRNLRIHRAEAKATPRTVPIIPEEFFWRRA